MSMVKFVLLMVLCSEMAMHDCKVIPTPQILFDDYSSCVVYGYDYSSILLKEMTPGTVDEYEMYTKFSCKKSQTI